MHMAKKLLFINQEMLPYVPQSEMSEVGRELPAKMSELSHEVRTFMPKWGIINERRGQLHEVIRLSGMNIIIDDTDHPLIIKVASIPQTRLQVYFIDNEDFFIKRKMAFDENGEEYADNGERAVFFARGVIETVKKLRWTPDVIHCQGWMSAVVPLYIKTVYATESMFSDTKIVTSLFDTKLEKGFGEKFKDSLKFREVNTKLLKKYNDDFAYNDLMKLAIDYSDAVVETSSDVDSTLLDYAKELNKPILPHSQSMDLDAYSALYEQLEK